MLPSGVAGEGGAPMTRNIFLAFFLILTVLPGFAGAPENSVPIRNARTPIEGVLSGGQPTPEQIELTAQAGFLTVINLRAETEPGFEWEREAVEQLGMRYVLIPVAGEDGLTRENVGRIDSALNEALERGPVLFHCASGNRIGAVLALRGAWFHGLDSDAALRLGLAGGLGGLESKIRTLLELPDPEAGR